MENNTRRLLSAQQVADTLSISVSYAYKVISSLNQELEKAGYLTIHGKVDSAYLTARFFPTQDHLQQISM